MGFVMPNQAVMEKKWGWFLSDIEAQASMTVLPILQSNFMLLQKSVTINL